MSAGLASILDARFDDVAAPLAEGVRPSARSLCKAAQMRASFRASIVLINAEALASIAQTFGDVPWIGGGFGRVVFVVDVGEPSCDGQ